MGGFFIGDVEMSVFRLMEKYENRSASISEMIGKTFRTVCRHPEEDELHFYDADGGRFVFYHCPDCCEYVFIEQIDGDLSDLEGVPLLQAEETTEYPDQDKYIEGNDSETWTFYKFATIKGYVTVRWVGSSNGYYSEEVDLRRIEG